MNEARTSLRLITEDELKLGRVLGHGAFGVVYKAKYAPRADPEHRVFAVAVKQVLEYNKAALNDIMEEVRSSCRKYEE